MERKILISTRNLQKYFPIKKKYIFQREKEYVKANKNITLNIYEGETLGIVGESGCGKSTFGRTIIQLQKQTGGSSLYYGTTIEDFMPKYVKKVYASLTKVSKNYDRDELELNQLKTQIKMSSDDLSETLIDQYRLKKIAFSNTYDNTLRLVGGLVVHPNLQMVSEVLLSRYQVASKIVSLKQKQSLLVQKKALNEPVDLNELSKVDQSLKSLELKLKDILIHIDKLKDEVKDHPKFSKYEKRLNRGIDLAALTVREGRLLKKDLQIIFQDPYSSLDPKRTVGDIIGEGLLVHNFFKSKHSKGYRNYILEIMEKCGLEASFIDRYPHQFSGGQRQRIGIARALALNPKFIVCDEAVSALDVSIQSQIINLLQSLKQKSNLTYLFITHDLGVVRYISDRIGVMYFGNLVELAPAEAIFNHPKHPYTKMLLNAMPVVDDDETKQPQWDITYDELDYHFQFLNKVDGDKDWLMVGKDHYVACTLKKKDLSFIDGGKS